MFGSLFPGTVPFGNNYRIPDRCEQFVIKNSTFCKKRRAILLKAFENYEDLKNADAQTLAAIEGIDSATAQNVYDYFHNNPDKQKA